MADGEILINTKVDTSGAKKGLDEIKRETDGVASSGGTAFSKFGSAAATGLKVAGAAVTAATTAVTAFGVSSVKTGADFDSSMSQVAATMGITNDELQNGIITTDTFTGSLRDFAQEMGSKTAFSATEAANALNYMALAGYDSKTAIEMLPNVLNLAAAGGIDLANASDMVTDAQTALGLSLADTNVLVDQMAQTSSKSNTSVSQLGEAILTIGGTAKSLAGGTTELNTVLGLLADNGIKGSEAGTKLRNIILSLSAPTDKAADQIEALGLSVFDAEGNMRPMEDIITDLNGALEGMGDGQKTEIINTIFNKADIASVNALLSTSTERWTELSGSIDDSAGAAEKMAGTQLDNLAGDVTLFQSALEGAKIAVSDQLTPTLREFVQLGSEGLSSVTEAFKTDGLDGAMDALGTIISKGVNIIIEKLPSMVDAGMKLLNSLIKGITDNLPKITTAAVQIFTKILNGILDNLPKLLDAALKIIVQLANGLAQSLPELVPKVVEVIIQIVETLIENVDKLVDAAIEIIMALANGLIKSLPKLIEKAPIIIQKLVAGIITNLPKITAAGIELLVTLAKGIIEAIPELVKQIPQIITAIVNGLLDGIPKMIDVGIDLIDGLWQGIKNTWSNLTGWVGELAEDLISSVKDMFGIASPSKEFKYIGRMCVEGLDEPLEDYNPYETVEESFKASAGTLQASFESGYSGLSVDSSGIGSAVIEAMQGIGIYMDGTKVGNLVADSVNNTLGRISARRV